jgi:hypothetical protein
MEQRETDYNYRLIMINKNSQPCVQRPLLGLNKSGCRLKVVVVLSLFPLNYYQFWKIGDQDGHCRQVVAVKRWSLALVYLNIH